MKQQLINWICENYIENIKSSIDDNKYFYYIIEKAFKLNDMSLKNLKDFQKELNQSDFESDEENDGDVEPDYDAKTSQELAEDQREIYITLK
jgi:hypothetical protein